MTDRVEAADICAESAVSTQVRGNYSSLPPDEALRFEMLWLQEQFEVGRIHISIDHDGTRARVFAGEVRESRCDRRFACAAFSAEYDELFHRLTSASAKTVSFNCARYAGLSVTSGIPCAIPAAISGPSGYEAAQVALLARKNHPHARRQSHPD